MMSKKRKYKYIKIRGYTRKIGDKKIKVRPHIRRIPIKNKKRNKK